VRDVAAEVHPRAIGRSAREDRDVPRAVSFNSIQ
jgi:hypothetical protein